MLWSWCSLLHLPVLTFSLQSCCSFSHYSKSVLTVMFHPWRSIIYNMNLSSCYSGIWKEQSMNLLSMKWKIWDFTALRISCGLKPVKISVNFLSILIYFLDFLINWISTKKKKKHWFHFIVTNTIFHIFCQLTCSHFFLCPLFCICIDHQEHRDRRCGTG